MGPRDDGGDSQSTGGGGGATLWGKLEETCRYYTGLPKPRVEARVVEFRSERQFVSLLQQGKPVAVAFTFSCAHTRHFDEMFQQASADLHPHVNFIRVDCPKHLGFCIARQRKDYPFIEVFYNSKEAQRDTTPSAGGGGGAAGVVRYSVMVLPYNYDMDIQEASKILYSRLQSLEGGNASKLLGWMLMRENADQDLAALAKGSDAQLMSAIGIAKRNLSVYSSIPGWQHQGVLAEIRLQQESAACVARQRTAAAQSFVHSHQASTDRFPHSDRFSASTQAALASLSPDTPLAEPTDSAGAGAGAPGDAAAAPTAARPIPTDAPAIPHLTALHGASGAASDYGSSPESSQSSFMFKRCHYFARGFCKHGSACRFLHASHGQSATAPVSSPGSPSATSSDGTMAAATYPEPQGAEETSALSCTAASGGGGDSDGGGVGSRGDDSGNNSSGARADVGDSFPSSTTATDGGGGGGGGADGGGGGVAKSAAGGLAGGSPGSAAGFTLERLEAELHELLREHKGPIHVASLPQLYAERFGKPLQAEGYLTESQRQGRPGLSLTKLLAQMKSSIAFVDRPSGQRAIVLKGSPILEESKKFISFKERADLAPPSPGSRQIYLTFPAESTFTEDDVAAHFSKFGPVHEVRVPHQQKRMFGFVTFAFAHSVKAILEEGNPHHIGGSRVLVKPYREKSRHGSAAAAAHGHADRKSRAGADRGAQVSPAKGAVESYS
ncbi:unnamed protein product, partial [Closterium sp. Yama58-4]